jgi:hypothetical protein
MKALKRETTIANRFPEALRLPSKAGTTGSGGRSIFIFSFVFLSVLGVSAVDLPFLCVPPCPSWLSP